MGDKVIKLENFKIDDSALKVGRKPINFRKVGEQVDPKYMTRKEFIHYLGYKFEFNIGKGWDGIERNPHTPNWTPESKYNEIKTREQAIDYLEIYNRDAPDNIEHRQNVERRKGKIDVRKNKVNRRIDSFSSRRKKDIVALRTHKVLLGLSFIFIFCYGFGVFYYNFKGI